MSDYLIRLLLIPILCCFSVYAQDNLPVFKSNQPTVSIQDGKESRKNSWRLDPTAKPDIYYAKLIDGKSHKVTFISDVDSISFSVEEGKKYDFIVEYNGKNHYTQIVGKRFTPAAVFDENYRRTHKGKIFVEIPEIYEMVNVAFAIMPSRIKTKRLVAAETDYYKSVMEYFDKYQNHPFVTALEDDLKKDGSRYFTLKMNAYSFEFNKNNKIVQSKIYDRTASLSESENTLRPYLKLMQSFADETDFRKFYRENLKVYQNQISFFKTKLNLDEMLRWLGKHFPASNDYDTYKIIFSPLVRGNQSVTWFENEGFKELQPHVEFPYRHFEGVSEEANTIYRGNIVFTEINHGFINSVLDKYSNEIARATSNRDFWVDKEKGPNYYPRNEAFNEYMNWVLVNLRITDYVSDREEQEKMIQGVDKMMVEQRGFPQFARFSQFLVELYRNRQPKQTVTDLYPNIIEWFDRQNKESLKTSESSAKYQNSIKQAEEVISDLINKESIPGFSVSVAVDGKLVWSKGFGFADLENRTSALPNTRFRIGSISKLLTVAAIAKLYEQKLLDLDAPVQKYVPNFPKKEFEITSRQLLGHLAGIRHYKTDEIINLKRYEKISDSLKIFQNDALIHPPNNKYFYSSYGYVLLSAVIEGAAKEDFFSYLQTNVLKPLKMQNTLPDDNQKIIENRTGFYTKNSDGKIINETYTDTSDRLAAGGLLSTAEDLTRFGSGILSDGFLKSEIRDLIFSSQKTNDGKETGIGFGWRIGKDSKGRTIYYHGGTSGGGRAFLIVYPESKIVVAMLANLTFARFAEADAEKIAEFFIQ